MNSVIDAAPRWNRPSQLAFKQLMLHDRDMSQPHAEMAASKNGKEPMNMEDGERLIIACPQCATLNRVPARRLADGGKCGKCSSALFPGQPIELTSENFERHAASSDIPLLVDFWAEWCGPCRQMEPGFASAASRVEPRLRLGKIDTEVEQAISARFGIRSIPSLILLSKGQEVARTTGAMPEAALLQWIENALAEGHRHFPAQSIGRS